MELHFYLFSGAKLEKPSALLLALSISVYLQTFNPYERCTCTLWVLLFQAEISNK